MKTKSMILLLSTLVLLSSVFSCDYLTGQKPESMVMTTNTPTQTPALVEIQLIPQVSPDYIYTADNFSYTATGNEFQKIVDDFKTIQVKAWLTNRTAFIQEPKENSVYNINWNTCLKGDGWLDVNQYFNALKHISLEDGYLLDYVYYSYGTGSLPILYVRHQTVKPLQNYDEYKKYENDDQQDMVHIVLDSKNTAQNTSINDKGFDNKIRIDGTPEGYFEYVIFEMLGQQFYLYWHAGYNDTIILCDSSVLDRLPIRTEDNYWGVPADVLEQARSLDFEPTITFHEDTVDVSVVIFTNWGGFEKITSVIKRNAPYGILDIQKEILVAYECGITF